MAERRAIKLGFTLVLLVFTILQSASTDDKCRSGCHGHSKTFKYVEGTTYNYNLDGSIDITLSNAEGQQSSTKLKAQVSLTQLPQCNQLLKLHNVQVIGPDAKKYNNLADIEKPIRINFQDDGQVENSICADPSDTQNSLNIKRAVASMFQAATKHNHDTDVFGVCPTEFTTSTDGVNVIVNKYRNLNKCAFRENIKQDFMATTFNLNSEVKSSPILNGEYTSEQRIKNGILDHAVVTEHYLYVPFSVGKNGAKASVSTKLHFTGTSKQSPPNKCSVPKSIIFENPHLVNADKSNADAILTALKEVKNSIDLTVGEKSAKSFVNLIKILRVSSKNDILAVYGQVRTGAGLKDPAGAKKIYLDAIFRAGTGDTIEASIELLKNKELGEVEQKLVYLSLAFVKHATPASLKAATFLLDNPNLPREGYLGVGTLAGRYCREHSCKNNEAVNKLSQKLLSKLGDGKPKNRQQENVVINVLKALANVDLLTDQVLPKVLAIAQDKKVANRLRVAALETLLAEACKDKVRDTVLNILKDIQQDSEIRIKAYLLLAQCPNGKVANAIKVLLENEPSLQVGGFITSHLHALKASTNPDKEHAKQHLGQIITTKKFPVDLRKYSFSNEFSYSIDTVGLASSVESNVIYSQSSFLPRSTNLNLTAQVFGHTFNFLEVGTRQENFEKVLEHYFGPVGVLGKATPEELLQSGKSSINKIVEHFQQRLSKTRGKRDVSKSEIEAIGKQVQIKTNELNTDLDLDLSVKIFGSELLFLSLNDQDNKFTPDAIIDRIFDCLDGSIAKAKNFEKTIQSNVLFLDSEFSYPTSLGFPLKLSVEGSSTVQLKASGSIDVKALLSEQPTDGSPLKLSLIPSANIEVEGSLTVDAQVVEGGLKVSSSLYTATGGEVEVVYSNNGQGLDVKFSLPVQKQKLISATHDIVFNVRPHGQAEVNKPIKFGQNKDFSICIDHLSPFIGLELCADINNPPVTGKHGVILPFPLSGNAKFSVGINREDLSHYHLKKLVFSDNNKVGAEFVLETIGANNNQKLSLGVEAYLLPEAYVKASILSPIITAFVEGRVTNNNQEKSVSLQFQQDQLKYLGKVGVSVSGSPNRAVYKPLIEYNGPSQGEVPVQVQGQIIAEQNGNNVKYTFDNVQVTGIHGKKQPYSIQGNVGRDSGSFFADLTVSDGAQTGSLKGKLQAQQNQLKINAEVKNSYNPDANFNIKYDYKREQHRVQSNLQLIHGQDLSSKTNKLIINNDLSVVPHNNYIEIDTKNKLAYPGLNLDSSFDFSSKPNHLKYDLEFQYLNFKVGSELDAKVNHKTRGDYDIEFEIYGNDNKLEIKSKREINGDKSKIHKSLAINGKKLEVSGTIKHHCKPDDVNIGTDLDVKLPGRGDSLKLQSGLAYTPEELDSHLKVFSGSNIYVDIFLKGTKGGNANGNLKINLENILLADGQLRATNGVGTGNILVHFVRFERKLKGEITFTCTDTTHNYALTFYPNFEKDTNKFVFITNNEVKENFFDSKNQIELLDKKLEFNLKGQLDGKADDGKLTGEGELILPSGLYFGYKINRELHIVNGVGHGTAVLILEQRPNKNAVGAKFTLTGQLRSIDVNHRFIDISHNYVIENAHGQILNSDLTVKRVAQGDQIAVEIYAKATGTVFAHPVEFKSNALYKGLVGTYHVESSLGGDSSLLATGKYDYDCEDHDVSNEISVELKTPSTTFSVVKFTSSGHVTRNQDQGSLKGDIGLFIDDNGSDPDATVDIKLGGEATVGQDNGHYKFIAVLQKQDPINIDVNYKISEEAKKLNGQLNVQYNKDKYIKSELDLVRLEEHEYKLNLKLDSPQQPTTVLEVYTKRSDDNQYLKNEITFNSNNKKFVLSNELNLAKQTPGFNIKLVLPDGKVDAISANLKYISEKDWQSDFLLEFGQTGFLWESKSEAHIVSIDEFTFKSSANCPALKLDKIELEALNKPSKGTKNIVLSVTSAGTNVLSGSTTYRARTEGDKYIVEGSGTYQVREESKQGNFKFIRQTLSGAKNGEDGVEISFNAGLGNKAIDSELKITNKQFRLVKSYCEEKQQCAHIEIDAKTIHANAGEFNHEVEVAVDLRKLGLSHEFGLKGVTARKSFVLDHTVDIYFQSKENKYQYSVYVHPTEAGIQLTTPKRIIALESNIELSRQGGAAHPIKGEIAFYLDKKNQPNQKTSLSGVYYCHNPSANSRNCEISTKFSNPALGKDLFVSYDLKASLEPKNIEVNFVADIFQNPNHKIVAFVKSRGVKAGEATYDINSNAQLKSQGLNIDITAEENIHLDATNLNAKYDWQLHCNVANKNHESQITVQFNPTQQTVLVKGLGQELLNVNSQVQSDSNRYHVNSNIDIYGVPPLASTLEVQKYNSFKYSLYNKNNPNNKLQADSHFIFGKSAEFNADIIEGGNEHKLIHHKVLLDEQNFLKSTSDVSAENIKKYVLQHIQVDAQEFLKKIKVLLLNYQQETNAQREQVLQLLQQNLPSLKPLQEYYQGELQKVREELISDKTVEAIGEFLKGVFGVVIDVANDVLVRVNEITEKVYVTANKQFARVVDIYNKQIVPKLTEIAKNISGIFAGILEQVTVLITQVLGRISVFVEAHQAEFRQISNVLFAITHDVGQFIYKLIEQAQVVVNKEWKTIYDEFKRLPIAEELKDKYKQLFGDVNVPETIINAVKQAFATIKDVLPSEDLKKFVTYLGDYVEKKLKGENVDDYASIQKIVKSVVDFVNKLFKTLSGNKDFNVTDKTLPLSWTFIYNLPKLVAVKFSPSSYIRNGEFPNLSQVLTGLSFNPDHWIPPYGLDAFIAQGQHIFTFDGKHLTFPGNCNYLLARDAVNGNFSIVGTYENGFLTALVFSDKHDVITIKKGGLIHLNNAAHELPVHKPHLDVYRLYETVNIVSSSGVKIICGEELLVCGVHVNGYYHGQLKGILGNGNYEPYDDYTIPNGKIVTSEGEFGNSYKLGNCPNVQTVDHHQAHPHSHNPACNKLFDHESQLSLCYKFVNPENFKIACDHGLAANIPDTEKAIAIAYVASCQTKFIPVHVPTEYVKCSNSEHQYSVGDSFSVKTPGKSADIVIVIDQIKSNEVVFKELVQPLITQIPTELASKGVTDVKFHIILYGGEYQKYPSHYTVQGKLAFKGKSPVVKFTEEPADVPVNTGCPHLDQIIRTLKQVYHDVSLIAGFDVQEVAYSEALKYPFRADAVKSIIAIVGKPCQVGSLLALQKIRALLFTNNQISLNLITPIHNFVAKDLKHTKNVIGFDSRNVFTFSDIKKKPEGSSELHSELNYDDYCIDFTIKNHGNVFVTNSFLQAKAASRKQFVQSATHNIVNHLVNHEQGLDCTCKMYSPYGAKNVCTVAYTKEKGVGKKSHH